MGGGGVTCQWLVEDLVHAIGSVAVALIVCFLLQEKLPPSLTAQQGIGRWQYQRSKTTFPSASFHLHAAHEISCAHSTWTTRYLQPDKFNRYATHDRQKRQLWPTLLTPFGYSYIKPDVLNPSFSPPPQKSGSTYIYPKGFQIDCSGPSQLLLKFTPTTPLLPTQFLSPQSCDSSTPESLNHNYFSLPPPKQQHFFIPYRFLVSVIHINPSDFSGMN